MSRHPLVRLWLCASLALAAGACKPAEEPSRRPRARETTPLPVSVVGAPSGHVRVTERVEPPPSGDAPPLIGAVTREHEGARGEGASPDAGGEAATRDGATGTDPADTAAPATVDSGPGVDTAAPLPGAVTSPDALPPELVQALARDVPASAREEARQKNKAGLEAHRKLALDVATARYEEALAAFPAFPFARYNLACAEALQKKDGDALFHLAVLAHLARDNDTARERLAAARVDADFELLRADPRFRALTGASDIVVTWVAGEAEVGRKEAQQLVKALREKRWAAKTASAAWPTPVAGRVVRVRGQDAVAETAAREVARILQDTSDDASAAAWPVEVGAALPSEGPSIVVIVAQRDAAAAPGPGAPDAPLPDAPLTDAPPAPDPGLAPAPLPSDVAPSGARELSELVGKRLRAETTADGASVHHQLELKATGFFTWDITAPGRRTRRSGRWTAAGDRLSLTFKQTVETPSADGGAPAIVVEDDMRADYGFALVPEGLSFPREGLLFK